MLALVTVHVCYSRPQLRYVWMQQAVFRLADGETSWLVGSMILTSPLPLNSSACFVSKTIKGSDIATLVEDGIKHFATHASFTLDAQCQTSAL